MTIDKITRAGIQQAAGGWVTIVVTLGADSTAPDRYHELSRKLVAGPFKGPGAKVAAIKAAGGRNETLPFPLVVDDIRKYGDVRV